MLGLKQINYGFRQSCSYVKIIYIYTYILCCRLSFINVIASLVIVIYVYIYICLSFSTKYSCVLHNYGIVHVENSCWQRYGFKIHRDYLILSLSSDFQPFEKASTFWKSIRNFHKTYLYGFSNIQKRFSIWNKLKKNCRVPCNILLILKCKEARGGLQRSTYKTINNNPTMTTNSIALMTYSEVRSVTE